MRTLLVVFLALGLTKPVLSDLIFTVAAQGVTASASDQTGFFEVFVESTQSPQPQISAHQLRLSIDVSSGITFEGAGMPSGRTYLGPSTAPSVSISPDKSTIDAGDFDLLSAVPLFDGAGLLRVEFSVPGGTPPGDYSIMFDSSSSFLANEANSLLPTTVATLDNAPRITVSAIPEPSAAMYLIGVSIAWATWRRHRMLATSVSKR
ncbi:hypothetical protein ACFL2H_04995 [Planctomycetota bacterium]